MASVSRPVYPYRKHKINLIPVPLLSTAEITTAVFILSRALHSLRVRYGLISSSAIFMHEVSISLPCLTPSTITLLNLSPKSRSSKLEKSSAHHPTPLHSSSHPKTASTVRSNH
ncbi:unnamed protein product [Diplocarpon coronariae]|nr:hypothetical protein JHW43_006380 [Diplocarpon mali]